MSYIGKEPADSFISFAKQDFSTSATTSYTLDNAVANENELALFINFVRQEPTTAYTASGTTLTLTSATASTDDMYCVYLGQAKQTVNAPDGSVGLSQLSATGTKSSSTFLRGDNTFAAAGVTGISSSADATAMTITSNENVGIGITDPDSYDSTAHELVVGKTDAESGITIRSNSSAGNLYFADGTTGAEKYQGYVQYDHNNSNLNLGVSGATGLRLTSNNRLQLATTSNMPYGGDAVRFSFEFNSSSAGQYYGMEMKDNGSAGTTYGIVFSRSSAIGSITYNASSVSYNTSSDYRLKENVSYDFDATTRLKQLKPARFNFIADADKTVDGFLAHEVSSVVPEAITGEKDAVNEDGSIQPQGIDQAKLVPVLTKALQEAVDKIEQLEARITTLENA